MRANFDASLKHVLAHEGGFVDHPSDPGGATNKGITIGTLKSIKPLATVDDLKNITDVEVARIYRRYYWEPIGADRLPSGIDYAMFDFAVNSGPARAAKFLQRVVGVPEDGVIGAGTIKATLKINSRVVIQQLCGNRLAWLKTLPHWPSFKNGWTSRVMGVEEAALNMADGLIDNSAAKPQKQTLCSWFRNMRK